MHRSCVRWIIPVVLCVISCRSADVLRVAPQLRQENVAAANRDAQSAVANAGCALGIADGTPGTRVLMIERRLLPFAAPASRFPTTSSMTRMKILRVSIPMPAPHTHAMLACLVPAVGADAITLGTAASKTSAEQWAPLIASATRSGLARDADLDHAVTTTLLDASLKSKWTSMSPMLAALQYGDPQQLPTMTVTANGNVVVFDINSVIRFFGSYGESQLLTWDLQVAQQQWSQDCAEWNSAMDVWEATRDNVAAAANEEANALESLADDIQAGLTSSGLETTNASCQIVNGKPFCLDFFIVKCAILYMQGDCRGFDPNADFESSRVQVYLNPYTMEPEVKYNCSSVVKPNPSGPNRILFTSCDSAGVFDPQRDLHATQPDADGWRSITMSFNNNACIRVFLFACPSIDATARFRLSASAPGGWQLEFDRDGFPSLGVYVRNTSNTGWDKVKESPQVTKSGITALRALAGQIRIKGYNYPAPGGQPSGCYRY